MNLENWQFLYILMYFGHWNKVRAKKAGSQSEPRSIWVTWRDQGHLNLLKCNHISKLSPNTSQVMDEEMLNGDTEVTYSYQHLKDS